MAGAIGRASTPETDGVGDILLAASIDLRGSCSNGAVTIHDVISKVWKRRVAVCSTVKEFLEEVLSMAHAKQECDRKEHTKSIHCKDDQK
jgi:hypothetical protein